MTRGEACNPPRRHGFPGFDSLAPLCYQHVADGVLTHTQENKMTDRIDWLTERQKGIGGSEIAAVCGLSKWRTPFDVWLEKTSPIEDSPPTLAMELGNFLEPLVVAKYREDTGHQVTTDLEAIAMADASWARCNLDGLVTLPSGDQGVLECKTAGDSRDWGEPGSDDIPADYFCQCQWNCVVAGLPWADVPVLFFDRGRRIECYHVAADEGFQEWMLETARQFWVNVQGGSPPQPSTGEEAAAVWPKHEPGKMVDADEDICLKIEQLKALKAEAKTTASAIKMIESALKVEIEDAEGIADGDKILATWRTSETTRLNTPALRAAHLELVAEFSNTTTTRRLIIK